MQQHKGSTVYQRPDGSWAIRINTADRPCSVHATLLEAERFARDLLKNEGGGLLVTLGLDQRVLRRAHVAG